MAAVLISLEDEVCTTTRPRLVLMEDMVPRRTARRRGRNRWDDLFFLAALFAVLLTVVLGGVRWLAQSAASSLAPTVVTVTVPVTVHSGDTLWTYARKYGAPTTYILTRVEQITRDNHISPEASLVPGEILRVPVGNPVLLAELQSHHRLASR